MLYAVFHHQILNRHIGDEKIWSRDEAVFAFGQRGGYLFESPSRRLSCNLPNLLQDLFKGDKVESTYAAVLGSGNSFFISYKDANGTQSMQSKYNPEKLKDFLYEKNATGTAIRIFDKTRVALGPYNESWFATDGLAAVWSNLPTSLDRGLKERRRADGTWNIAPRIVALGVDNNFVLTTEMGGCTRYLPRYPVLDSLLDTLLEQDSQTVVLNIQAIFLDPHRQDCFIMQSRSTGYLMSNGFPPFAEDALVKFRVVMEKDTEIVKVNAELSRLLREVERIVAKGRWNISLGELVQLETMQKEAKELELKLATARLAITNL